MSTFDPFDPYDPTTYPSYIYTVTPQDFERKVFLQPTVNLYRTKIDQLQSFLTQFLLRHSLQPGSSTPRIKKDFAIYSTLWTGRPYDMIHLSRDDCAEYDLYWKFTFCEDLIGHHSFKAYVQANLSLGCYKEELKKLHFRLNFFPLLDPFSSIEFWQEEPDWSPEILVNISRKVKQIQDYYSLWQSATFFLSSLGS